MGLFGGNKETSDAKDTQDIKTATMTNENKLNQIDINSNNSLNQNLNQSKNNFQNPFANQQLNNNNNNNQNLSNQNLNIEMNNLENENKISTSQNIPIQTQQEIQNQSNLSAIETLKSQNEPKIDFEKIQEMIDETVEKIIDDKWEKLLNSVEKVVTWKEKAELDMNTLRSGISEIQESFSILEKKLTNKISSYDSGLLDVNSEIKALEKVFQKITPTLINNVNELSSIAKSIKESTGIKTSKRLE